MSFSRRSALFGMGTLAAAASANAETSDPLSFDHGVASGDPLADKVIIWTRITGARRALSLNWQVAQDEGFKRVLRKGVVSTGPESDFTAKVDVTGLKPGQSYFYRFVAGDIASPIGRTRTLPAECNHLVMAIVSCALHPNGYFNAYQAIADMPELDVVVHLGDYIYEYGGAATDYGMTNGLKLNRIPEPPHEAITLEDYRLRHAQYRREPELQAAHARAPWICVFDDHEIADNPWKDGAYNHNPGEGDWGPRKAAAIKAYREWLPIRDAAPGQLQEAVYRSFRFGKLAELVMLETRLVARTQQLEYAKDIPVITLPDGSKRPDIEGFRQKLNDPMRELLGAEQRGWLKTTLQASVDDDVKWQVLGNQVLMARIAGADVAKLMGPDAFNAALGRMPPPIRGIVQAMPMLFSQKPPLPVNLDAWDGYPAERERLYEIIKSTRARMIVVSGDSHSAWANQLSDAAGNRVGIEIGVTSISSPTRFFDTWMPDFKVAQALEAQNEEVIAADDSYCGFVRLTLTFDRMKAEWMSVDTISTRSFTCVSQQTFEAASPTADFTTNRT